MTQGYMAKGRNKKISVDTSTVLRYVLADVPRQHQEAKEIFLRGENGEYFIYLDEIISVEIVWVLIKMYKFKKNEALNVLSKILKWRFVINPRKKMMLKAIILSSKTQLSYPDAWLYILSRENNLEMKTFDQALAKS